MYFFSELSLLPFLALLGLWTAGGNGLLRRFDLPSHERLLLGLGVGLSLSTLLANLLGRFLPAAPAFWLAALLPGLAWLFPLAAQSKVQSKAWLSLFFFASAALFFTLLGRGLGIFDDYQNLPQVSSLALGDLPPHFAYAPNLLWSYHYFLPLVAAQFTRLANAAPWVSMDAARGLTLALTLFYAGFWAWRKTQSLQVSLLAVGFLYLAGGARWLLWLLPARFFNALSESVTLIGSGADSGANLAEALANPWKIQGQPPLHFPFVFGSGLDPSLTLAHAGYGVSALMLVLLLFLLAGRGQKAERPLLAALLAALALANEVTFVLLYAGLLGAVTLQMALRRSWRLPPEAISLAPALLGGLALALLQGGVLSGAALNLLGRLGGGGEGALYQVSFTLRPPTLLSAHLGRLSVLNPLQWPAILAEAGLTVFLFPWLAAWGRRIFLQAEASASFSLKTQTLWEMGWLVSALPSLLTVFLAYTGNAGPTALSRITAHALLVSKVFGVVVLWGWLQSRGEAWKVTAWAWGAAACWSGAMLLALQLSGMPNPVRGEFLSPLDEEMFAAHWGTLDSAAWVFDPLPARATTVLGLHANAGENYGPPNNPTFVALMENPTPQALAAAGYTYLYADEDFWQAQEKFLNAACAQKLDDRALTDKRGKVQERRVLLDLRACR